MMTLPPKTHIWIAAGVTDMRRGFDIRPSNETLIGADFEQQAMFHAVRLITPFGRTVLVR